MLPLSQLFADGVACVVSGVIQNTTLPRHCLWQAQLRIVQRIQNLSRIQIVPEEAISVFTWLHIRMRSSEIHAKLAVPVFSLDRFIGLQFCYLGGELRILGVSSIRIVSKCAVCSGAGD